MLLTGRTHDNPLVLVNHRKIDHNNRDVPDVREERIEGRFVEVYPSGDPKGFAMLLSCNRYAPAILRAEHYGQSYVLVPVEQVRVLPNQPFKQDPRYAQAAVWRAGLPMIVERSRAHMGDHRMAVGDRFFPRHIFK